MMVVTYDENKGFSTISDYSDQLTFQPLLSHYIEKLQMSVEMFGKVDLWECSMELQQDT